MKVYFTLEAGMLYRSNVRQNLINSKHKLEHWYPGCKVLLTENKTFFESSFYFEADNLPDSAKPHLENWMNTIKSLCND